MNISLWKGFPASTVDEQDARMERSIRDFHMLNSRAPSTTVQTVLNDYVVSRCHSGRCDGG